MTTMATLSSMVDNAITVPENGVINFKLLRAFLHSLIQHLQLDNTIVKYETKLEETESDNVFEQRKVKEGDWYSKDSSKDKIIEDYVSENSRDAKSRSKLSSTAEDVDSLGRKRSSTPGFIQHEILETVARLEEQVKDIALKLESVEKVPSGEFTPRASQEGASTSDSLKLLSISKRLDACEESLHKLAPALQELANETCTNTKKFNEFANRISALVPGLEGVNEFLMVNEKSSENYNTGAEMKKISFSTMQQSGIDNKVIEAFTEMHQNLIAMKEDMSDLCSQQKYISSLAETMPVETISELQNQISELQAKVQKCGSTMTEDSFIFDPEKITELEKQIKEHSSRVDGLCNNFAEQLDQSQGHISDMEKDLAIILEKINVNSKSDNTDMASLGDLNEKIMQLQEEVNFLNETTNKLSVGQEDKEADINTLLQQIEQIKIMKADKEALEDALTDKADALTVNRKVSHDQFDAAFEELNRTIEEAQEKLAQQEKGWLRALEEIQNEISSKIDRIEITPLKEMIENKMQNIQERIKAMTAKRREIEALGTKKKMIRNLNCISCDTKVVMRATLNGTGLPRAGSLPPNRSMRPYLTYELDQVRRQNKCLPTRSMQHFVNAVAEQRIKEAEPRSDRKESHICNRYCGGSHTIMTSQQRVTRVGHFPDSATVFVNGPDEPLEKINTLNEKHSPCPTPRSSVYEA